MDRRHIIFASYGNDSIALIQWAYEKGLNDVFVVYSDTGWAADYWEDRARKAESWVDSLGFDYDRTESIGMRELVKQKQSWPRGGGGKFQFCTEALKKKPAKEWLEKNDPDADAVCMVGIRRLESRNRADHPEWIEESASHGGRDLWCPLVRHTDSMRDELINKTPFEVLPYKSKECWPCVNAGKKELKHLEESKIILIEDIEREAGINSKGNARVMFSPKRHNGAVGIRSVVDDAQKNSDDLFTPIICNSGWCYE